VANPLPQKQKSKLIGEPGILCAFVITPSEKRCLAQLLVCCPFRISYFAHQPWLNPLNLLWDFWRIFDRRFIKKSDSRAASFYFWLPRQKSGEPCLRLRCRLLFKISVSSAISCSKSVSAPSCHSWLREAIVVYPRSRPNGPSIRCSVGSYP
jgi:hypothetical protein